MAYIDLVDLENADGMLKAEYEKGIQRAGKVYNILKIMSRSPAALRDSMKMYLTIMHGKSDLSRAQREMIATVVSQINQCHYWTEAHGADFRDEVKDEKMAKHLKHDWKSANLVESDQALCRWAAKLTTTPGDMTKEDINSLENNFNILLDLAD